jgi:copper chaperone NosL
LNKTSTQQVSHSSAVGIRILTVSITVIASVLLLISLKYPLWQMRLEAPQYRGQEALRIAVHPNAIRGDVRELSVLNQYIGVHIPPTLPQFKWLPATLVIGAVLMLSAAFVPAGIRRLSMVLLALALIAALTTAAIQAHSQIYKIGHNRDQHTPLAGVRDFTPPFLGTTKIAQFEVSSRFGLGAWLIGGALALEFSAAWLSGKRKSNPAENMKQASFPANEKTPHLTSVTT